MYAQLVDDETGQTLACSSSLLLARKGELKAAYPGNRDAAKEVGLDLAARAKDKGFGAVRFDRGPYKFHGRVLALAEGLYLGRDLINTPASDFGPAELEAAARDLANTFGATVKVTEGSSLLSDNFPMIHAVGRASDRSPRLIDMHWGADSAPKVTIVGKGICFDTGGLNLKPGGAMGLMKKDMGGSAAALAFALLVMRTKLPVRLRVLIPAADNSVAGNAFRPGDVLTSRSGLTLEQWP